MNNFGAIIEKPQKSDFKYHEILGGASPFDWEKGFELPETEAKDQANSSACGGFACSYFMETYFKTVKSPKFIYSLAKAPQGGSAKTQLAKTLRDFGCADESICGSFQNGTCSEEFVSNRGDLTEEIFNEAKKNRTGIYTTISKTKVTSIFGTPTLDIDLIAQAIRDNGGVIIGLYGINNGTWRTEFPKSTQGAYRQDCWRHWVFGCGVKLINGKKHIKIANSWGKNTGNNGYQWLNEEHIKDMWDCWTVSFNAEYQFTQTLRFGMSNSHVGMLQKKLKELGYFPKDQSITSYFGVKTRKAVMDFQKAQGLKADGVVGALTNTELNYI